MQIRPRAPRAPLTVLAGLGLGLLGAATSTDLISLRAVAHGLDLPMVSDAVIGLRQAMPTRLAHTLEPSCAILGLRLMLSGVWPPRLLGSAATR